MLFKKIATILVVKLLAPAFWLACRSPQLQVVYQSDKSDTATPLNAPQIYHLKKKAIHADFPYEKLAHIDSAFRNLEVSERVGVFAPVKGRYNYYQFLATFKGETLVFPEENLPTIKDFHDILIIKTDDQDRIIDAYHFTTEWAEYPMDSDLFKLSQTGLTLKDGLNIQDTKLKRVYEWSASEDDKYLAQQGVLKLPAVK